MAQYKMYLDTRMYEIDTVIFFDNSSEIGEALLKFFLYRVNRTNGTIYIF